MLFSEELFTNLFVNVPYLLLKPWSSRFLEYSFLTLTLPTLIHLTFVMHYFYISVRDFSNSQLFYGTLFLTDDISFAIPQFLEFRKEISSFAMLII